MGKDRGCGLRENRPGLNRPPAMVSDGGVTVVRATQQDRPARFGLGQPRWLSAVPAVVLEVSHPRKFGGRDERREDFGSLTTTVAGWLCDMRSAQARERLLAETAQSVEDRAA